MKASGSRTIAAVVFVLIAVCIITVDAQSCARSTSSDSTAPVMKTVRNISGDTVAVLPGESAARVGIRSIRTVDFYLRSGKLVFGKLISEDRNKVMLEQVEGSKIVVATYSKRDMESRSLQTKNISAARHYQDMAEYFAGRIWDFKDDPDDFIQAIRFYKRAQGLIEGRSQLDRDKSKEIDRKVAELEADRQEWTKQIETRSKLKELEFQAEFLKKFEDLEAKLNAGTEKLDESTAQIDEVIADVKANTEKLEKTIPTMEQDLRRRMDVLGAEVEANRRLLDPYGRSRRDYGYNRRY